MKNTKCKICRRLGTKLFLKGEKCFTPKCPIVKKPYPPGIKGKKRRRGLSEYGKELKEKQKLKSWYGLEERQFRNYVKEVLQKRGKEDAESALMGKLESRLDNVVFRLGFANSRFQARQLVSHGHFQVNSRKTNYPSYQVKKGDLIKISPSSLKKNIFQNLKIKLKKYTPPNWLELDKEKFKGKVLGAPTLEETAPPAEVSAILEFYSR
ncbi:MAG: 30S ribosomal protein S4 [Candidatus Nealsonbacteria bacterium CG23_combo_of_CG06-09_8_20_14_all_36_12]|uniref:Small ribosomal subunit protein uS4 n=2 Tax=Candidatus Nealsoniibacteriota TaxID=1817911 RepID=A0A2H0TLJ6_9BACT|nr:MAG: 30S ribosomal protein S4 [Candidatus Nealsonbacteria bacterium CG23_combo_of_CG06-09_8_20_14_all_36_12]PIR73031.1 MAG: 30S ribosomal protein S4 [Candidatus Nealsonbacteria bacterium CG10_big_fil_rev_8_21_14_0_10_36_23]